MTVEAKARKRHDRRLLKKIEAEIAETNERYVESELKRRGDWRVGLK